MQQEIVPSMKQERIFIAVDLIEGFVETKAELLSEAISSFINLKQWMSGIHAQDGNQTAVLLPHRITKKWTSKFEGSLSEALINGDEACADILQLFHQLQSMCDRVPSDGPLIRLIYIHTKPYVSPSTEVNSVLSDPKFFFDSLFVRMTGDAASEMVVQTAADCARLRSSVNPSLALVCGYDSIELEHAFADLLRHPSLRKRE